MILFFDENFREGSILQFLSNRKCVDRKLVSPIQERGTVAGNYTKKLATDVWIELTKSNLTLVLSDANLALICPFFQIEPHFFAVINNKRTSKICPLNVLSDP